MDIRGLAWFPLVPNDPAPWPMFLRRGEYIPGGDIHYELSTAGCFPLGDRDNAWSAEGGTATGAAPRNPLAFRFKPMYPAISITSPHIPLWLRFMQPYPNPAFHTELYGFAGGEISPFSCGQETHGMFCVPATPCVSPNDPARTSDCASRPEYYAVIPFSGARTWRTPNPSEGLTAIDVKWGVCCGCGRRPDGAPPPFEPRVNPCKEAAIELAALVGKLRQLRSVYQFHERDFKCADCRRDQARDALWGPNGSVTSLLNSVLGLITEFGTGLVNELIALLSALGGAVQDAGAYSQIMGIVEIITAEEAKVMAAEQVAKAYLLAHPGDISGALRIFYQQEAFIRGTAGAVGRLTKFLSLVDIAKSELELEAAVIKYYDWKREADSEAAAMDDVNSRMGAVQAQIDGLRSRCPNLPVVPAAPIEPPPAVPCPDTPGGSVSGASACNVTSRAPNASTASAQAQSRTQAAPTREQIQPKVDELHSLVNGIATRLDGRVYAALSPFIIRKIDDLDPRFLSALLADALADLQIVKQDLDRAVVLGRDLEKVSGTLRPGAR